MPTPFNVVSGWSPLELTFPKGHFLRQTKKETDTDKTGITGDTFISGEGKKTSTRRGQMSPPTLTRTYTTRPIMQSGSAKNFLQDLCRSLLSDWSRSTFRPPAFFNASKTWQTPAKHVLILGQLPKCSLISSSFAQKGGCRLPVRSYVKEQGATIHNEDQL